MDITRRDSITATNDARGSDGSHGTDGHEMGLTREGKERKRERERGGK